MFSLNNYGILIRLYFYFIFPNLLFWVNSPFKVNDTYSSIIFHQYIEGSFQTLTFFYHFCKIVSFKKSIVQLMFFDLRKQYFSGI
jgi:hypothetical protein